jgi:hypothetical protein
MIHFYDKTLDDEMLFNKARESFFASAKDLFENDREDYDEYFAPYGLEQLHCDLLDIAYVKMILIDDLSDHFESPTQFMIHCNLSAYIVNKNGEKEKRASYLYIWDENMNVVDDFLRF